MMRVRAQSLRSRRAFTLIEMIGAITILATLGSIASMLVFSSIDGYADASIHAQLHQESSAAMDRALVELRRIDRKPGLAVAPDIASVTATSITWNTNWSLALNGSDLELTIGGGAPALLLSDVTDFQVQTYDESNAALPASLSGAACDPIRRIRLQVTQSRHNVSHTLRLRIFIRSTM